MSQSRRDGFWKPELQKRTGDALAAHGGEHLDRFVRGALADGRFGAKEPEGAYWAAAPGMGERRLRYRLILSATPAAWLR